MNSILQNNGPCVGSCPPQEDFNCTESEDMVIYNQSVSNTINDITPGFFTVTTTNLGPGDIEKGVHGAYSGNIVVQITGSFVGCLRIYINDILVDSETVNGTGNYTLTASMSATDCCQIILNDDSNC